MDWIKPASIIALGAVFGANLRYFVSDWLARHQTASFPLGTLAVNTTGGFVLTFFLIWATERVLSSPQCGFSLRWASAVRTLLFRVIFLRLSR